MASAVARSMAPAASSSRRKRSRPSWNDHQRSCSAGIATGVPGHRDVRLARHQLRPEGPVAGPADGPCLDEARATTRPGARQRLGHRRVDRAGVRAVDGHRGHPERVDEIRQAHRGERRRRVLVGLLAERFQGVVLAQEDDRRPAHRGDVHRLVPGTLLERTVAEQRDAHPVEAQLLERERGADRDGQRPADARRGGREAVCCGGEVERAALPPVDARGLAQDLRDHTRWRDAPRDEVAVVAVRRVRDVPVAQQRECRHSGRLLADIDMEVADVVRPGPGR